MWEGYLRGEMQENNQHWIDLVISYRKSYINVYTLHTSIKRTVRTNSLEEPNHISQYLIKWKSIKYYNPSSVSQKIQSNLDLIKSYSDLVS